MTKRPPTDMAYHGFPGEHLDEADKNHAASALPTEDMESTQISTTYGETALQTAAAVSAVPTVPRRSFLKQLVIQLVFLGLNAVLGIGAACCLLPLITLSVAFIPLGGLGLVLFQLLTPLVLLLARLDVAFANLVAPSSPQLTVDTSIRCGFVGRFGDPSYCEQLSHPSPRLVGIVLYFMILKLVVGILSFLTVAIVVAAPIVSLATGGREGTIWSLDYEDDCGAYLFSFVLFWMSGAFGFVAVPNMSVKATKWLCTPGSR